MKFRFEHRIETLSKNALLPKEGEFFEVEGIRLSHWDFNLSESWLGDAWLAKYEVEADKYSYATKEFTSRLNRISPRIAFVSQCYTVAGLQPFLISRDGSDLGYAIITKDERSAGLMFMEEERKALKEILETNISDEFFLYWNDAVNSPGYSAKILLMCSAIEAYAKSVGANDKATKFNIIEEMLGTSLKQKLYGIEGDSSQGLRHRLVHGDYLSETDSETNYFEEIHRKIIVYFNSNIFKSTKLSTDVVNPQRHPFGLKSVAKVFLRSLDGSKLNLHDIVEEYKDININDSKKYELVYDKEQQERFLNENLKTK